MPDVVFTETVEILPLGITLQVIEELAEEDGGTHAAVPCHCELPRGLLQRAPHLQDLFQTWKDTLFRSRTPSPTPTGQGQRFRGDAQDCRPPRTGCRAQTADLLPTEAAVGAGKDLRSEVHPMLWGFEVPRV